eukprot:jgi/Chrzof1/862/Cz01g31220.t1
MQASDGHCQQPTSKLHFAIQTCWQWATGSRPRTIVAGEISDGKQVTAFAEQLLPLLYKAVSPNSRVLVAVKLLMFLGLNTLMIAMLFIYPRFNTFFYLQGNLETSAEGGDAYRLAHSRNYGMLPLFVDDHADGLWRLGTPSSWQA